MCIFGHCNAQLKKVKEISKRKGVVMIVVRKDESGETTYTKVASPPTNLAPAIYMHSSISAGEPVNYDGAAVL